MNSVLDQYFTSGDRMIVGVSGGPDSTALLDVLVQYSPQTNIVVVHINHGIRGKASDADEKFVRQLAKFYGLKCEVKRVKLAKKTHQEELGRKIRREFFEKLRAKYHAKWIVTAHTQDDQIETIVFNFLRGSGPAGLAGMKVANGFYLKPFLHIPKAEILQYLKERKLQFRKDATNADMRYKRNFIRKKILPLFLRVNPSFQKTLLRNAETFRCVSDWLNSKAEEFLNGRNTFSAKEFQQLPPALQRAVLQCAFRKFSKQLYRLSAVRIEEMVRLVERRVGGKKVFLGKCGMFRLNKGVAGFVAPSVL